jgi:hypothetical protein
MKVFFLFFYLFNLFTIIIFFSSFSPSFLFSFHLFSSFFFSNVTCEGVNTNIFNKESTPGEIVNHFLEPIKGILINNIHTAITNNPIKYSNYIDTNKITREKIAQKLDKYIAANIQIRKHKKKSGDKKNWWSETEGDLFIRQCISRDWYQVISTAMFDMPEEAAIKSAETTLDFIKTYTQACFSLPRFITIDECMTLVRIHHLVSNYIYF